MFRNIGYATLATLAFGISTADAQWKVNIGIGPGGVSPGLIIGQPNGGYFPGGGRHHNYHYHVQYRQLQWKVVTFSSPFAARQFERQKESEGFQAIVVNHGSHFHVRYRMLNWQPYRTVHSHGAAHHLERALEMQGFDARVIHH